MFMITSLPFIKHKDFVMKFPSKEHSKISLSIIKSLKDFLFKHT